MAGKTKKKTSTSRSKKTSARRRKKQDVPLEDIESSMEGMALTDFARSTKEELKKLGEHIHEATDKGIHVAREIAEDVRKYAQDATTLTKLKIELHNLKEERDKTYSLMGKHLSNLYKAKKLSSIKTKFKYDFAKLKEIESAIDEKEKLAAKLSLT
jgi:hypothetical protein